MFNPTALIVLEEKSPAKNRDWIRGDRNTELLPYVTHIFAPHVFASNVVEKKFRRRDVDSQRLRRPMISSVEGPNANHCIRFTMLRSNHRPSTTSLSPPLRHSASLRSPRLSFSTQRMQRNAKQNHQRNFRNGSDTQLSSHDGDCLAPEENPVILDLNLNNATSF